jgi:hypothetical protein
MTHVRSPIHAPETDTLSTQPETHDRLVIIEVTDPEQYLLCSRQ